MRTAPGIFDGGITRACVMPNRSINALELDVPMFSRGFVRRRVISLATSLSVMATSFALAQDPKHPPRARTASDIDDQLLLSNRDLATRRMAGGTMMEPTGNIDRSLMDRMILCPIVSPRWRRPDLLANAIVPGLALNCPSASLRGRQRSATFCQL